MFFSSDVANPDTYPQFYADLQMYTTTMTQPDPAIFMQPVPVDGGRAARPTNGRAATSRAGATTNTTRSTTRAEGELDPVKRAALFIQMNDMVVDNHVVIPVVYRPGVSGDRATS